MQPTDRHAEQGCIKGSCNNQTSTPAIKPAAYTTGQHLQNESAPIGKTIERKLNWSYDDYEQKHIANRPADDTRQPGRLKIAKHDADDQQIFPKQMIRAKERVAEKIMSVSYEDS